MLATPFGNLLELFLLSDAVELLLIFRLTRNSHPAVEELLTRFILLILGLRSLPHEGLALVRLSILNDELRLFRHEKPWSPLVVVLDLVDGA